MTDQEIIEEAKKGLVDLDFDDRARLIEVRVPDNENSELFHNVTFQKQITVDEDTSTEEWEFLKLYRNT